MFALALTFILFLLWKLDFIVTILNLKALRPEVPSEFAGVYDEEKYAKSQRYTAESARFEILTSALSLGVLLGFWWLGGFGWLDTTVRSWGLGTIATGLCYLGILYFGSWLISLPAEIYDTFVIEEKYGFNKTTPATFITDQLKGHLLTLILGGPLLALVLWIFISVPVAWLWAWLAFTAFTLLLTYLAPTYILPLFNKFEPMPEGETRDAIMAMSRECDFPLTDLYVMDGSKRSTKSNAFFTGFGKNKKIALFDTLIENHGTDELVGVLAHEIGHFKRKHIVKRMVTSILTTGVVFFLLGLVTNSESAFARQLFDAFRVPEISIYVGIVLFSILFKPVSRILGIFSSASSRKHEFEADEYAARAQGTPEPLITALKTLSADNLANLTPHPLRVAMDYSHPPTLRRIDALRSLDIPAHS